MLSPNKCKIKSCRICGNKTLVEIGSLGDIAISDFTDTPSKGTKYPLTLVYCRRCTLLQLLHNTPRELLYKNYWYESHLNPVIVKDLKEIAKYSKGKNSHIDIGSNDGTLLKYSKANVKSAVDPSNIDPGKGIQWYNNYWEDTISFKNWDLITAIAVIYDLPDPNKFIRKVKESLSEKGLFIAQLMTLQPMIDNNDVGNICHEHLEYYSYKSLVYLFAKNGLEIFKVEKNTINGGSYRIFARHYKKGSIDYKEKEYGVKELKAFFKRIVKNKKEFIKWAQSKYFKNNVAIVGFGASTKMQTITQYYGCTSQFIVDVNPNKLGKKTIMGAHIINIIPEWATHVWVFPYGFIDYFKKKEKKYKGKWVTTIPEFKII